MITVTEYKNQKIGVLGLGKAGEAAVAALLAGGAEVWAWDDNQSTAAGWQRPDSKEMLSSRWPLSTVHYTKWPWGDLKALVLSPGVPLTYPRPHEAVEWANRHRCPVIGEVELLFRACPKARFVGITGTNGKSTTTALIAHILNRCGVKTEVGGNLGTPALALEPLGEGGVYVIEMSSYQLDLVRTTRFNVAVLLNLTPDHIDRHGSMEGYVAAKMHIFDRQQAGDVAVVAVDDEHTQGIRDWALGIREVKVLEVSSRHPLPTGISTYDGIIHDNSSLMPNAQSLMPLSSIPTLTGRHNWQNAAAAWAACRALGVSSEAIYAAMKSFPGLRHRMQLAATIDGVRFINDSKATNADATSNALAAYENIYWIAGGKPKEGGIVSLAEYFPRIRHVFLIGEAEEEFAETLEGKVAFTRCTDLKTAVEKAAAMALASPHLTSPRKRGEEPVVLLSPACASFDQFKNFEERGDRFCELAANIAAGTHE